MLVDYHIGGESQEKIILSFGTTSTELNWDRYRIFYKKAISGVTEGDNEKDDDCCIVIKKRDINRINEVAKYLIEQRTNSCTV